MTVTGSAPARRVLIIGGSPAGLQAAMDLADAGVEVHLVDSSPFLGRSQTNPVDQRRLNTRWLEASRHANICIWPNTTVIPAETSAGHFHAELHQAPRYVDLTRCTACGECITACPVTVTGVEPEGTLYRKAIYLDGQPGCAAIDKRGTAPCRAHCPINQRAQGYIALIRQGRFADAYRTIKTENPFPSVCGRVCNHRCEDACSRGGYDEPVNIMGLKRFVADWAFLHRSEIEAHARPLTHHPPSIGKRIAIIGAGPAGLTAALDLVRMGYAVTVFDTLPMAGGMMRVGIPPHRLPDELLDWEIQQIVDEGVEICLNKWVDDIPALLDQGTHAVLIATGAHSAKKLPIRNSNHPNNWLSLDILRKARLSVMNGDAARSITDLDLTDKKVIVLGGGNVALDTARTMLRLGAKEVRMACLEPRGEMPGFKWEVAVAEAEGIQMYPGRTFKEIVVQGDEIAGVRCVEIEFHGFKHNRPEFTEIPGSEHTLPAELVVWAIGQSPNFSFLPQDGSINTRYPVGVQADENMMTTMPGVFVAGDVRRGVTFFVVDAIAEGHIAATSIHHYLLGKEPMQPAPKPPMVTLTTEEIERKFQNGEASAQPRVLIQSIPLEGRTHSFQEVDLTLTEAEVLAEADRCLRCGICSECLACEHACIAGAVIHEQSATVAAFDFGAVIETYEAMHGPWLSAEVRGLYRTPTEEPLHGSAAAAWVMADLGVKTEVPKQPQAAPSPTNPPARIGVFVCQCGGEIANTVDTYAVGEQAAFWPGVATTQVLPFSCSTQAAETISEAIEHHELNRVVLAACACCAIDQVCDSCTYQRVRCKENMGVFPVNEINKYAMRGTRFEFANIREQCAWVHENDPQAATTKAIALVAAAVARARRDDLKSQEMPGVHEHSVKLNETDHYSVLILGSGTSGLVCHELLNKAGIPASRSGYAPKNIRQSSGMYVAMAVDQNGNEFISGQASAIVLSPTDAAEAQLLLSAFQQIRPRKDPSIENVDTSRPGVFYCTHTGNHEWSGAAAAARAAAWLGRTTDRRTHPSIQVNPAYCRACGTCIEICEFGAPQLVGEPPKSSAWIDASICTGCGICAVHCPSGAILTEYTTELQLEALLDAILEKP
jgi:NADPH-dependent glutamate synthase beta subunit-like oxidoreductase/Pyruvate/2-oxoacid:ferredoxin oxidoreductase delta subunit